MSTGIILAVFYLVVFVNYSENQGDGIVISLRGREIPNHGLVTAQDIGVYPNGTHLEVGLSCNTTYDMCCSDFNGTAGGGQSPSGVGSWLYAHSAEYVYRQEDRPQNYGFGIKRNESAVYLFRDPTTHSQADGIWRCVIPDSSGTKQTKYIGIYSNETTNGMLSVGTPIQFSVVNENPVVFNLTFRTTGGPATYVTWTRDGINISSTCHCYTPSQTVLDLWRSYTAGDYSNILTVSGRLPGVYGVSVTNGRTRQAVTSNASVADFFHFNLVRSKNFRSINVSWISVCHPLSSYFVAYEVQYTKCSRDGECAAVQSVNITERSINHYTLLSTALWSTYNFTVLPHFTSALNIYTLPGPTTLIIETTGVLAPLLTSVIELDNITSVQVIWNQPEGGLMVDEYVVSYRRLNGREGQCSSFQDEGSVTIRPERQVVSYVAILHLKAYSSYVVNVTGMKGALYNTSDSLQFETNSTVPSGAPKNFTIINSTSTSVTLSWNSVECIHRNGLITQYLISYGCRILSETNLVRKIYVAANSSGADDGGTYTATELEPSTNYVFTLSAVNNTVFGPSAVIQTLQDDDIIVSLRGREIPNHGLVTTQDIGFDPNGTHPEVGLSCSTIYAMCCSAYPVSPENGGRRPSGVGSWIYAHYYYTPYVLPQAAAIHYSYKFGIRRIGRAVRVFRNSNSQHLLSVADGIWRCVIPDSSGREQIRYIGVYSNETNNGRLSSVSTPSTLQFFLLSEDPAVFNLTFRTTGGPATYVTWTRDGLSISTLRDIRYKTSQTVLDNGGVYTAGHYSNILTVTGRLPGVYGVSVTNDRTREPVTSNALLQVVFHPNVSVRRSEDFFSINLSWNLTALFESLLPNYFIAYEVRYTKCFPVSDDCESIQSVNITERSIDEYDFSNISLWSTYKFTVLSHFNIWNIPSVYVLRGPIKVHTIETQGVLAPVVTSVTELANVTSAEVTWNQPDGGLAVNKYVVSYYSLKARGEQCSTFQDEGTVIVKSKGEEGVSNTAILTLKAYHVYVVQVTAMRGALYNASFPQQFVSNSTVLAGSPQNLTIINSTSTSVTISWNSVECILRNGLISHYIVSYELASGKSPSTIVTVRSSESEPDDGGSYTATRLEPSTNYLFRVAAINSIGLGPFATVQINLESDKGKNTVIAVVAGVVTTSFVAVAVAVLILAVIAIWVYRIKRLSKGKGAHTDDIIYEEPKFIIPLPTTYTKTCPAYEVTKM